MNIEKSPQDRGIEAIQTMKLLLDKYLEKAQEIRTIISNEDNEDRIFQTEELLNYRDKVQVKYDQVKEEYLKLKNAIPEAIINQWDNARQKLLAEIGKLDAEVMTYLTKLHSQHSNQMQKIQDGKRLHNAYDAHHPTTWGVYVDRKK